MMTTLLEIEALRRSEAHQQALETELDLLARGVAHLPYRIFVTPQMPPGTWAIGKQSGDNEITFVVRPQSGRPDTRQKPPPGHMLIVARDVARMMGER